MTAFVAAAAAMTAALAPPAYVCARGRPIEGAIALQLCGAIVTLVVLCLAAAAPGTTTVVVAVLAAALTPVSALLTARMLGHDV